MTTFTTHAIALMAASNQNYVSADQTKDYTLIADRTAISPAETFQIIDRGGGKIALQAVNGMYVCAEAKGVKPLIANRTAISTWETFQLSVLPESSGGGIALKAAANNKYVSVASDGTGALIADAAAVGPSQTFYRIDLSLALKASNGLYVSLKDVTLQLRADSASLGKPQMFTLYQPTGGAFVLMASNGKYVCADDRGAKALVANRDAVGSWETFQAADLGDDTIALRAVNNLYVSSTNSSTSLIANAKSSAGAATFAVVGVG